MTTTPQRQRSLRSDSVQIEGAFLPLDLDQLATIRRAVIEDLGESAVVANGLVGWLVEKASGEIDTTTGSTRSRYRKILARLMDGETPIIHDPATVAGAAA